MNDRKTPAKAGGPPISFLVLCAVILTTAVLVWSTGDTAPKLAAEAQALTKSLVPQPESPEIRPEEVLARPQHMLLEDHLDEARIQSPLVGLAAAHTLKDLADPAMDRLLDEGFEEFEWEFEDWPRVSWAEIAGDDAGQVLQFTGFSRNASIGWVLPVRSDSLYHFERSVKVLGEPFCDLYVVESTLDEENARPDPDMYFLAGRGAALKVHSLEQPLGSDQEAGWQRSSTSFHPSPRTKSLVVLFRPRVGADGRATVRSMSFDDVRLEEISPTRQERIRLLKASHLAQNADSELGMRKAGLLLPLPSPRGVQAGEAPESNYDWRRALYAPPTTELSFDLTLPADARLRLATGLARETPLKASARFQVELTALGGEVPVVLLDEVRVARMEEWSWKDMDLDLTPWAGQEVCLTLRSLAEAGDPHPLWANPRIEAARAEVEPLVILIAVDTLRADHLGSYGYERATSPALDQLAEDGVRFDQARSNCNWTCPSFASIFTGMVPSRHGVSSYGPATPLPDEMVTLAEHFQAEGWNTRSIAYKVPLFDGNYEQGFDQSFNVPRDVIQGEENLARALEWLEANHSGPRFLFLHFNDPHQPFVQPEPYDRNFGPGPDELGYPTPFSIPNGNQEESRQLTVDLYDGAIGYVDDCIGRFLDALRERGLYDSSTIAFVADHGEQLWEHGRFGHGGDQLFDEVVRVPLIVKSAREDIQRGQVLAAEVSAFDVMPTLLELAGIQPANRLDALSLVPLMTGEREAFDRPVVTETSLRGLALVDAGHKYVLEPGGLTEALYHLTSDPLEQTDVRAERPEQLARLRKLAIAYILEHRPGNFLLVRAGEVPSTLTISTRSLRTLVGPSLELGRGEQPGESSLTLAANAWGLLEIEDPAAEAVKVSGLPARGSDSAFTDWVPGGLPLLSGAGLWRISGPQSKFAAAASGAERKPVDEEQLEALRRLGYVD